MSIIALFKICANRGKVSTTSEGLFSQNPANKLHISTHCDFATDTSNADKLDFPVKASHLRARPRIVVRKNPNRGCIADVAFVLVIKSGINHVRSCPIPAFYMEYCDESNLILENSLHTCGMKSSNKWGFTHMHLSILAFSLHPVELVHLKGCNSKMSQFLALE